MKRNFNAWLDHVLKSEAGWADDPRDAGGATMKGVTLATFRRYKPGATKADLRAISDADLRRIYRDGYWNPVRGDDLPTGLDLVAFDASVNSGPSRGAKWVQEALGVTADGQIGPATLAAAKTADLAAVINRACSARLAWLRTAKNSKTGALLWPTFGVGWTARVKTVRETALASLVSRPVTKPGVGTSDLSKNLSYAVVLLLVVGVIAIFALLR